MRDDSQPVRNVVIPVVAVDPLFFQDWVTDRLARHLRGRLREVAERTEHLGTGRKVPMYPDLELWAGDELDVGDVKYKLIGSGRARNADYYQLLAYATALGLSEGLFHLLPGRRLGAEPKDQRPPRRTVAPNHALDPSGTYVEAENASKGLAAQLQVRAMASV